MPSLLKMNCKAVALGPRILSNFKVDLVNGERKVSPSYRISGRIEALTELLA